MRVFLALPLALAFACAGMSSSTGGNPSASSPSCGDQLQVVAYRGAAVYPGPDTTLMPVVTLKQDTPVCASTDQQGFGFRKVKLADGKTGYIEESRLSI